jgi:hypothetical protein
MNGKFTQTSHGNYAGLPNLPVPETIPMMGDIQKEHGKIIKDDMMVM